MNEDDIKKIQDAALLGYNAVQVFSLLGLPNYDIFMQEWNSYGAIRTIYEKAAIEQRYMVDEKILAAARDGKPWALKELDEKKSQNLYNIMLRELYDI